MGLFLFKGETKMIELNVKFKDGTEIEYVNQAEGILLDLKKKVLNIVTKQGGKTKVLEIKLELIEYFYTTPPETLH